MADTLTIREAARFLRCPIEEVQDLIAKGEVQAGPDGIERGEVLKIAAYEAIISKRRPIELVEGVGETRQTLQGYCADCEAAGLVYYVGSVVLDGDLEWYHLIHTEVRNHYECARCSAQWSEFRFL